MELYGKNIAELSDLEDELEQTVEDIRKRIVYLSELKATTIEVGQVYEEPCKYCPNLIYIERYNVSNGHISIIKKRKRCSTHDSRIESGSVNSDFIVDKCELIGKSSKNKFILDYLKGIEKAFR